jgi:hypothetical protein
LRIINVTLTGLSANGVAGTTTTTRLTLTFNADIEGLTGNDITVNPASLVKGALEKNAGNTGVYTLEIIWITAAGTVTVTVNKTGYRITGSNTVMLHKKPPKSLKATFDVSASGVAGVSATFNALHDFIQNGGLTTDPSKIALGDWIDLDGGLPVDGNTYLPGTGVGQASEAIVVPFDADHNNPGYSGTLLRLIVVGINSFNGKNGNNTRHVVFQFQNIPVKRGVYDHRSYLPGTVLTGLIASGVPEGVLWAPTRLVAQSYTGSGCVTVTDKLWLPTELEMCGYSGFTRYSNASAETEDNQARLEYYVCGTSRIKYGSGQNNFRSGGGTYWLASPAAQSQQWHCTVDGYGRPGRYNHTDSLYGIAPAFCVQ